MVEKDLVLILDFGSQTTQLIARRVRESKVYCEIHPCTLSFAEIEAKSPRAIILSGGPASVYEEGAPSIDPRVYELGLPILGICYGMQLLSHQLGGKVERSEKREYGLAKVTIEKTDGIFHRFAHEEATEVWMSHGDRVVSVPPGFENIGLSENTPFCAVANPARKMYGVQFHPEVVHTARGTDVLASFLFEVCKLEPTWTPGSFTETAIEKVRSQVAANEKVVCGLSGGVDSSVAAILCQKALGDRLTCIFVDNGLLRQGEFEQVVATFRETFRLNLIAVDAKKEFLDALQGVSDPEQKRKIIGRVFIEVFDAEAKKIGDVKWLVQGTLYPDVIESVSFKGPSAVIKSHHNVGGLPERMKLKLIEPLRELFKDEVRAAGVTLGMPSEILGRQPFPGPGLAIRCLGELSPERLAILRKADAIVTEEIRGAGLYDEIWQSFCVLLPVKSVGVMGDHRTYEETCAIRAVKSLDGMTADWAPIPYEVLGKMSNRIINEVRGINRVVYDISSKPPATIEWE